MSINVIIEWIKYYLDYIKGNTTNSNNNDKQEGEGGGEFILKNFIEYYNKLFPGGDSNILSPLEDIISRILLSNKSFKDRYEELYKLCEDNQRNGNFPFLTDEEYDELYICKELKNYPNIEHSNDEYLSLSIDDKEILDDFVIIEE